VTNACDRPTVVISGVLELSRLLRSHALVQAGHTLPGTPDAVRAAAAQLPRFWTDGLQRPLELLVLADAVGAVFDRDPSAMFDALATVEWSPPLRTLAMEDPFERGLVLARLERLRDDETRAAWTQHLRSAWALLGAWWQTEGIARAEAQAATLLGQLAEGPPLTELLPVGHIGRSEAWRGLLDVFGARGRIAVVPTVVNPRRGYAHDLGDWLVVGVGWADDRTPGGARRHAAKMSEVLRPLVDPTRLALLLFLADHARSVNQLADEFDLAPATVSAHLRILRDVDLVEEVRHGKRTLFRSSAADIRSILQTAEALVRDELG